MKLPEIDVYRQHCAQRKAPVFVTHSPILTFVARCTDGGEIWHGGGDRRLPAKFHPHRCNNKGIGPPKLKFVLRFDQNVEYKRPVGAYPLRDFHKICRVCTHFRMR